MNTLSSFIFIAIFSQIANGKYIQKRNSQVQEINNIVLEHVISEANKPISFHLKHPVIPFIGRIEELSEIKWAQIDKKVIVITGVKGVGKTELARKYALDVKHDNSSSIIWIDATNDNTILSSFKDLAIVSGIKLENKVILSVIREAIDYFSNRKTLMIFDGAPVNNTLINNILHYIDDSRFINVIITSRDSEWNSKYKIINLQPFTKEESAEYLKLNLEQKVSFLIQDHHIEKLNNLLGYLPRILHRVVKYIEENNILFPNKQMDDYLKDFENKEIIPEVIPEIITRPPNDQEIEDFLRFKVEDEAKRVGEQIKHTASDTWEKVSSGVNVATDFVSDKAKVAYDKGIKVAGETIVDVAKDVGQNIKKIFG